MYLIRTARMQAGQADWDETETRHWCSRSEMVLCPLSRTRPFLRDASYPTSLVQRNRRAAIPYADHTKRLSV